MLSHESSYQQQQQQQPPPEELIPPSSHSDQQQQEESYSNPLQQEIINQDENDVTSIDSEQIWDELSHLHSQEIEQHSQSQQQNHHQQQQQQYPNNHHPSNPISTQHHHHHHHGVNSRRITNTTQAMFQTARQAMNQTATALTTAAAVAKDKVDQYQLERQRYYSNNSNSTHPFHNHHSTTMNGGTTVVVGGQESYHGPYSGRQTQPLHYSHENDPKQHLAEFGLYRTTSSSTSSFISDPGIESGGTGTAGGGASERGIAIDNGGFGTHDLDLSVDIERMEQGGRNGSIHHTTAAYPNNSPHLNNTTRQWRNNHAHATHTTTTRVRGGGRNNTYMSPLTNPLKCIGGILSSISYKITQSRQQYLQRTRRRPHYQQQQQQHTMNDPLLDSNMDGRAENGSSNNSNGENPHQDFHWLDHFRLLPKRDGIELAANLDLYFTSLYTFYYHKGLVPIAGKGILDIISLFFTLWLSVFLFVYLDWKALFLCVDETSCQDTLQSYIIDRPFSKASFWNFLVILYILLFTAYGMFSIMTFFTTIKNALEAKYIYEDKLGISMKKLEGGAVEWHEIVQKLLHLQQTGEYRVAVHERGGYDGGSGGGGGGGSGVGMKDELAIAQRILRRENFMVAFFNRNMLDLTVPIPWPLGYGGRSEKIFYSKSLELSIYFCVLSYMFNHKYQIRPSFYADPVSLKRRFAICGIAHAIFMPFLLFFMVLHFFMQNLYSFRSSQQYMGPREWSDTAKWTFREFNELPHVFERRLGPSYDAAESYLKLFPPSSIVSTLGRLLVFLSGSLAALFIALAAVNDAILLHVKVGHWNLLWYVGVLGVAYSIGNGMLPNTDVQSRYHRNLFGDMDAALSTITSHTHHYPEFWKKRGWDDVIKKKFSELYQFKVQLFLMEVVSVIVAPFILCFTLPQCAEDICTFVQKTKIEVPGSGDHCGFSTFDFDLFADENWEGQTMNVGNISNDQNRVRTADDSIYNKLKSTPRPMARQGKMEKSFFNFKAVHPNWKCSSTSGQDLVNRIENYQNQQALALARERQHHIAAAARQLETLKKLEEVTKQKSYETPTNLPSIDEHHIVANTHGSAGADSGGGGTPSLESRSVSYDGSSSIQYGSSHVNLSPDAAESVLHYTDIGLSTELQNILNTSTFDPESSLSVSVFGSKMMNTNIDIGKSQDEYISNNSVQRQYMWLERYHSQIKSSIQEDSNDNEIQMNENGSHLKSVENSYYSTTSNQHQESLSGGHSSTDSSSTVDNASSTGSPSQLSPH